MRAIKLLVLGPLGSGKSTISNFLADTPRMSSEYDPTAGVRILKFILRDINLKDKLVKTDIELWDTSGDFQYNNCWPAIRQDTQGALFVYGLTTQNKSKELEELYQYFIHESNLGTKECLFLYNDPENKSEMPKKLPSNFARMSQISYNLEEEGDKLKFDFRAYVSTIVAEIQEKTSCEQSDVNDDIII